MRKNAADIAWKFANKLRDKYPSHHVVTAMIAFIYIYWEARKREVIEDDPIHLIKLALKELIGNFDLDQSEIFLQSKSILEEETQGFFYDDYFKYIRKADDNELKELLSFLIKRTGEIDRELEDFTNSEISTLFAKSIDQNSFKKILDPCIGSGNLIVELAEKCSVDPAEISVHGIEKNPRVSFIAYVNLKVNGFNKVTVRTNDVLSQDIADEYYDLVISDLPLGIRLRDRTFGGQDIPANWRFYHLVLQKCLQQLKENGVAYFSSTSQMIRDVNRFAGDNQTELQINTDQSNYAHKLTLIADASQYVHWSYTGVPFYLLGFNNAISEELTIKKIAGTGEVSESISITKSTWFNYDHINDPVFFLSETFKTLNQKGKSFTRLSKYFNFEHSGKSNQIQNEELKIPVIRRKNIQNISGWAQITDENIELIDAEKMGLVFKEVCNPGAWLIIPSKNNIQLAFLATSQPVYIQNPDHIRSLYPVSNLSELEIDWLKAELGSNFVQEQIWSIAIHQILPKKSLAKVLIEDLTDDEKRQRINELKELRIQKLEDEQNKLKDEYRDVIRHSQKKKIEEEFDLIHDLHHTLKNDLSSINGAVKSIENYLLQKEKHGETVKLSEPIKPIREGADPKLQVTVKERIESLKSVITGLSNFVSDYKTILSFDPKRHEKEWIELKSFFEKYGNNYDSFILKVNEDIKEIQEYENRLFVDHYELFIDKEVFRLVFQNIIDNAVEHGFNEDRKYNIQIDISEKGSIHDAFTYYNEVGELKNWDFNDKDFEDTEYRLQILIKNDGDPFPSDIDKDNYFARGEGRSTRGSGIGGFHIRKGIESLGGRVTLLEPDESDPFKVQLLIEFPIQYVESPNLIALDMSFGPDYFENL